MFLRQSTAYTFRMGPFLDATDGVTPETSGLDLEDEHIRISKDGANFIDKADTTTATHDEFGYWLCVLGTTDTNTCGELLVAANPSGALAVFKTFFVVEEAIYDALFAPSADLITKVDAIDTVVDAILVDTGTTLEGKIDTIDGIVDAILVDTGTTLDGKINTIDGIVDSILVDTGTTLDGKLDTIDNFLDTEVAAILADTNELQADWVNGGRLDLLVDSIISKVDVVDGIVDSILVDTAVIGSAGAGLTAVPWNAAWDAEVQSECTDALNAYDPPPKTEMDATWTTAMTESYASDGAAMTPAQALYMILCAVSEFTISSTTVTGKKLDGSTTAMTWTLTDATSPTSRTRAS